MIGFSAVNTANNLLYIVTSAMLGYMLISGIFGRRNLHHLDIDLIFPEERFAETPTLVTVKVHNRRRFMPTFLIRVSIEDHPVLIPFVGAGSTATGYVTLTFPRRGRQRLSDPEVSSVFPFNFFTRTRHISNPLEVVVFPKLQRCPLRQSSEDQARVLGDLSSNLAGHESDILSIRNYVAGDPLKIINWKATAKTGRLKTKELASSESPRVMLDFHSMRRETVESTLSCLAYWIVKLSRSKIPVGLSIDGDVFRPDCSTGHKKALLKRLALHDQG
jgi:uncharacterized protein (DUF58 family)